jgi:uncharacterized repeat protein (TIGR03803 family)
MLSLKSTGGHRRTSGLVLAILSLAAWSVASTGAASAQVLTTLTNFNNANGQSPYGGLIIDANGDLFGTTLAGGTSNTGTVFEVANSASGYSSTPTSLVNLVGYINGEEPLGGLIADANGDLFGTTYAGGAFDGGTVFEIVKTTSGYSSTPITLVNFNGNGAIGPYPHGDLIADANGDLFGTTIYGGTYGDGMVFEVVKTTSGYASTPTTLVSFNSTNGANPHCGLMADANGDLFGTTQNGGASGDGTVFEIVKTTSGYASTPTTLVNLTYSSGANPYAGLIADANGDLFGTTFDAGAFGAGTVFEIVKTTSGYASTPTVLVNFNVTDGQGPQSPLIADAIGDFFGTTEYGGASGDGTVFKIVKTTSGYASTPITLVSFNGTNGEGPRGVLLADANGDLFGTTEYGGLYSDGTLFELTGSGFVTSIPFASFQPDLAVSTAQPYAYALVAGFTTSAANTAIDPATEVVTLAIANYTVTIPAGSFKTIGSAYLYEGTINGVTISAGLTPLGKNSYAFAVVGSPENLSSATNPVMVKLTIGINAGSSQVNPIRVP